MNLVRFWFCWRKHFAGPSCTFTNVLLESLGTDRPVFWRERESGLNVKAFFVAKVVGEPSKTDGNKEGTAEICIAFWLYGNHDNPLIHIASLYSFCMFFFITSIRILVLIVFSCGYAWGRQLDRFGAAVLPSDFCWKLTWLDIAWSRILDTDQLAFVKQKHLICYIYYRYI